LQGRQASGVSIQNLDTCIDLLAQINAACGISERLRVVMDRSRLCAGEISIIVSGV
jgi:hypothetical protein